MSNDTIDRIMSARVGACPHPFGLVPGRNVQPVYAVPEHELTAMVQEIVAARAEKRVIENRAKSHIITVKLTPKAYARVRDRVLADTQNNATTVVSEIIKLGLKAEKREKAKKP